MFNFFNKDDSKIKSRNEKLENECDDLREDKIRLTDEVAQLKLQKKIEDEDIKHLVKMKEERLDLQHDKKMQALEAEFAKKEATAELEKQTEIGKVKDDYRDKTEALLHKQAESMQKIHSEILARLPNISMKLKGEA